MIEQRSNGRYNQGASRLRYIRHLRSEHQRSARLAAEIEHTAAKAELLRLRVAKERRELVPKEVYVS
jgi:hypothetical protein